MRNWTIKDAVNVIEEGKDSEAIKEIAKHFPEFFMVVCNRDMVALANAMTEKMTVRRLQFGADATEPEDDGAVTPEEDRANREANGEPVDYNAMSNKQLIALCEERGIKVPKYGKNKQFYIDALEGAAKAQPEAETEETEAEENPYEGKPAMALYKMCKKRGIPVEPKKPAKTYIALLLEADAEEAEAEEAEAEAEEDDWGEEEAEETKPATKPSKAKASKEKATKGKAKAKPEPEAQEDEEDDEWDI